MNLAFAEFDSNAANAAIKAASAVSATATMTLSQSSESTKESIRPPAFVSALDASIRHDKTIF